MTRPSPYIDATRFGRVIRTTFILLAGLLGVTAAALDPTRALTQTYHRVWQLQQGLPQAAIYRIRQTSDGYIWLATQTGLVRFDGMRFTSIDEIRGVSLHGVWVRDLLEDQQHNFWIATQGAGLICRRKEGATRFGPVDGLPTTTVNSLLSDSHGTLWACTPHGIARNDHGRFTNFTSAQGLAADDVQAACESTDGSIWIGGVGSALTVRKGDAFRIVRLQDLPSGAAVHSLLSSPDGTIWVGSTAGLLSYKDGQEHLITEADGLAGNIIFCLELGRDGEIWVGTQNGFSRVRDGKIDSFRPEDGLSQSTVHTLCVDREGSLWAGTKHGLDQFLDRRTVPFTTSEGLPSNNTGPVLRDAANGLWVGTIGAGLAKYDGRHFTTLNTAQGLPSNNVRSLALDRTGKLWVGTDAGVAELHDGKIGVLPAPSAGRVVSLAVDKENKLWAASDGGVAVLRDGRLATLDNRPARTVFVRNDGTIVAAFADGSVVSLQGQTFQPIAQLAAFKSASCFFDGADGDLWIGSRGNGLALLHRGHLTTFLISDGLYDDDLYAIVPDNEGKFWFACSKGIFAVPRSQLLDFAAGKIKTVMSTTFSPTDALRTVECKPDVSPAGTRAADGKIWFSTIHGAIEVDPANMQRRGPPPDVLVEDVVIDGQSHSPAEVTELAPGTMNLEFGYTALSFLSPARTTFHYKLEGFDKDWVDAGTRRQAFYTNLPPGKYRFRVMANVLDGASAEAPQSVSFRLDPHFYQRAFFVPILVAIALGLVSLLYWSRIRAIHLKNRVVLAERSRIARELHDTLMQGFSGVTMEMQAFSIRLEQPTQRKALDEIIRDAGTCLREARQSIAGLRTGTGPASGLGASITLAARQAVEGHEVRLKLAVAAPPRPLAPEVDYNLLNIAKEAIANALKHSGCRTIEVYLETVPETLMLTVKDDGSGIVNAAGPGHYGIVGMKERAAQIAAKLEIESKANRGTAVRVTVPLPAAAADATEGKLAVS